VEDRAVLGAGDAMGRRVERLELDVLGAAIAVAQLGAREREVSAQLDHGQHAALQRRHAVARRAAQLARAAEVRRRELPPARP
jgi:hypothetical protein